MPLQGDIAIVEEGQVPDQPLGPVPSVKKKMERIKLQGEITSPINPDKGCRFAKRCVYAKDICRQQEPALREVGEGHFYACHLAEELGFVEK